MIEIKDVTKTYKMGSVSLTALKGVAMLIPDGGIISIMGKSGSGKSTLLRQIGLLDTPTSGEIIMDEHSVNHLTDSKKYDIRLAYLGYIFQEYAILPELTAFENVYLPGLMLSSNGIDITKRAKELLGMVGLENRLNHLPKELSGGEQQRVAIARALINNPRYILADEPCANLDSITSKTIMETLVDLNKGLGVTVIFVSHDPDDKKYSNQQFYLKDGQLVEPYL